MGRRLPNTIDVFVGRRIRLRRTMLEMGEGDMAAALGVSVGEIRKVEKGESRVSARRLERVAEILDVHFYFFFEDLPSSAGGSGDTVETGAGMGRASGFLSNRKRRPIRWVVPGRGLLKLSHR
ncbi:Transcriptional regulator, Cro/CI family [Sinorhizobium sojae CCBAU 05684]|uniref:Transcriptional regulator, Cro/CI family n=1 Tax=Sinorhizobium sojae CCBAU 05684 TaxID=716928 RepID=A0A249PD83_9HYPH|nr:helix-turn-helix transcriptional regulator [Sinorhizobium sojae]ASY63786.1 Transcriptional regulator, Cro/CI family [Sinorhizobium sojae CCBAU 05684]